MSENIEVLRAELARAKRPVGFWTGVVITLSFVFLGEGGLVVAPNAPLHRPVIVTQQPQQEPAVLVGPVAPHPQPQPMLQPQPQPQPQPETRPQPQPHATPKPKHPIDVSVPVCPPSDPNCGIDG